MYNFDRKAYDELVSRGLSKGMGNLDGQVCLEAAVCAALGLTGYHPTCVADSVINFSITLNDYSGWGQPETRAKGLRDLGIAQLGSKGVVSDRGFCSRLSAKVVGKLVPSLLGYFHVDSTDALEIAISCAKSPDLENALAAAWLASLYGPDDLSETLLGIARARQESLSSYDSSFRRATYSIAEAATHAHQVTNDASYLFSVAALAVETLRELNSPGVALL